MMKPVHQEPNSLDNMKPWKRYCSHKFTMTFWNGRVETKMQNQGCDNEIDEMLRINLCEAGTNEKIFISVAWMRAFNDNQPIYLELCHEFYSTYEFDNVCTDDEVKTKKIIKFRLGGRAHSLTLLEFTRRLGLYHAEELDELWERMMMKPVHQEPNSLDNMKPWKMYCSHKFTMTFWNGRVATKTQNQELCHEFYSTYEFDNVCTDDEVKTKKIIKFRLGGRAHSLTLLEFTRRLGLYHAEEFDE
nr:hypothetical protein [Tanacetum cinerariifolium]